MKFAYILEKLNLRTLCPNDNPMADFEGRFMSVEANLSWTPQFGDVGENKNLPVPVLAELKKAARDWVSRPDTSEEPRKGQPVVGEARESTDTESRETGSCVIQSADSRGGQNALSGRQETGLPSDSSLVSADIGTAAKMGLIVHPAQLSYKDELTKAMDELAKDPLIRFVGYGVKIGRAMGTLKNVPDSQLIEMPVAESLMVSFGIGLSLRGLKPVIFFERMDFILNALDAIVNHLDKIGEISHGEFKPTMILRIVVGNLRKPLFTGKTHTQDLSVALRALVSFPVIQLMETGMIREQYEMAHITLPFQSSAIVEYKDQI